jgi:hypothetical protein
MDTLNKKENDLWSKTCSIQGINFDALTFVDDIAEIIKGKLDVVLSSARVEVFEMETRLKYKPPKCKLIVMNKKEEIKDEIKDIWLEIVKNHEYLGTIVSEDGSRNVEISSRINATKSVCNEIVQILKTVELSQVRLRYVNMLSNACVDSKVKYGCAVWNKLNEKQTKEIDDLKVNLLKRVLEMAYSTPSSAIMYEFGVTDLHTEVEMEKILLMCTVKEKTDSVAKVLLQTMLAKNVPGFCTELLGALRNFDLEENDLLFEEDGKKIREKLKRKIVEMQSEKLGKKMLLESKCDRLLLNNFSFDGRPKRYLMELSFMEAKVIFMLRARMFPTKDNFKGRWGTECRYCTCYETDLHLFSCAGYTDLLEGVKFEMFMSLNYRKVHNL